MATPIDLLVTQQPWFRALTSAFGAQAIPESIDAITSPGNIPQPTVRTNRPPPSVEGRIAIPDDVWLSTDMPPAMARASAPAPSPQQEIGPGIPVAPSEGVTSMDIAAPASAGGGQWWRALMGRGGGRMSSPISFEVAAPPVTHRYDKPEFIYTNPASAQQAASNYAARLSADAQNEASYRDYLARNSADRGATQRSVIQSDFNTSNLAAQQAEGAANRASAERIAMNSELVRQQRQQEMEWQENERAADIGEQTAAMLNKDPNVRVDKKWVYQDPATGVWKPRFSRKPRPTQQQFQTPPAPQPSASAPPPVAAPISY